MARLCRWFLILLALMFSGARISAAGSAESRAFDAAAREFQNGFWKLAEADFEDFTIKFPRSARLPEAILYQAEAAITNREFAGAIDLLSRNQAKAGQWADQYLFWIANAHFENTNYAAAAGAFGGLIAQFPGSSNCLDAVIGEATARARLEEWPRVVGLLQQTDGVFQQAARTNAPNDLIAGGYLLLGEAQLAQKNPGGVEAALQSLNGQTLNPKLSWQRQYLQCRLQLAQGAIDDALQSSANLLALAAASARPDFLAESAAFRAGVYERLKQPDEAIADYKKNLVPGAPPEAQRRALLKIAELYLGQEKIADAIQTLENFPTNSAVADMALLTLGELQLKLYLAGSESNRTDLPTNLLAQAGSRFEALPTNSPLFGKALLDKGWCLWYEKKIPQSLDAFQRAAELLPSPEERAEARFKWADAQFAMKDFAGAMTNYEFIVIHADSLAEAKEPLIERALYQLGRAALEAGDIQTATNRLQQIVELHPDGYLLPEVWLAIARTYEMQRDWGKAIARHESWLNQFTTNAERPRVEYYLAWDNFMAGRETNAMTIFTNLVAQFPTNDYAPLAQEWIADHFFRQGDFQNAEKNYQLLFQNTNWQGSPLIYPARMMAGRAAVARGDYDGAIDYFTKLTSNTNCPKELRMQATFAYGDALVSRNSTNDLNDAIGVFKTIPQPPYGINRQTVRAWGRIGDCFLQLAATNSGQYENATNYYQMLVVSPDADVAARSQAEVGLGIVAEKQAEQKNGAEQIALLEMALKCYAHVLFGNNLRDNEEPDLFWVENAGLKAGRIAETLQEWQQAINVYTQLGALLPSRRSMLENKILNAQKQMANKKS
jgi:TolA-binding protein